MNQLKKGLEVGMKFELTNNLKKYVRIREVVKIQSNGFFCKGDDTDKAIFMDFPKASKCAFYCDRFELDDGLLVYKYI